MCTELDLINSLFNSRPLLFLQQMVAKLKLQCRSDEDAGEGDMRTGTGGGHTLEREEISI